jgi:hypothetical protein
LFIATSVTTIAATVISTTVIVPAIIVATVVIAAIIVATNVRLLGREDVVQFVFRSVVLSPCANQMVVAVIAENY